jgi:hypothetical protein
MDPKVAAELEAAYKKSLMTEPTPEDKASAKEFFGKNWDLTIEESVKFAEDNDHARERARNLAIQGMTKHWKGHDYQKMKQ